jgi:hypothetical protein
MSKPPTKNAPEIYNLDGFLKTFSDMQASKHPLSNAEIDQLAKKNPSTWARFQGLGVDNQNNS